MYFINLSTLLIIELGDDMENRLGHYIEAEMKKRKWNANDLAKHSSLSPTYVRTLLKGKNAKGKNIFITTDTIKKLAKAFEVDDLFIYTLAAGSNEVKENVIPLESAQRFVEGFNECCKYNEFPQMIDLNHLSKDEIQTLASEMLWTIISSDRIHPFIK